ncbi:hypothetical protein LINGRAHAP2_LOCUS2426, partial [Linum grandiflorum]
MDKFVTKRPRTAETVSNSTVIAQESNSFEFDENSLEADPGLRKKISSFNPNVQDKIRRFYLQRGPCQPR